MPDPGDEMVLEATTIKSTMVKDGFQPLIRINQALSKRQQIHRCPKCSWRQPLYIKPSFIRMFVN